MGPLFGYFPEETKCWIIVKPQYLSEAKRTFADTKIQLTMKGKRHLGAIIGSTSYHAEYVSEKVAMSVTSHLCDAIKHQNREFTVDPNLLKKKSEIRKRKFNEVIDNIIRNLQERFNDIQKRFNDVQKRLMLLN